MDFGEDRASNDQKHTFNIHASETAKVRRSGGSCQLISTWDSALKSSRPKEHLHPIQSGVFPIGEPKLTPIWSLRRWESASDCCKKLVPIEYTGAKELIFWLFDWLIDWLTGCLITISKWQVHWIGYCFITLAGTIILLQIYSWYSFCIKEKGCSNTCSIISYS